MLQLSQGDGLLTVVTDSWIWQNDQIGDYDHAWLLWYLTQDREVTLLYRADRDDLFSLLLRHFPEALLALSLLLAAGLWAAGLRQGPLQPVPERQRRQLQEHLRSSADFLLRHAGQRHLLQALQRDIQRRARLRHPGFDRLGVAEQWQVLGRMTRLTPSAISQACAPSPTDACRPANSPVRSPTSNPQECPMSEDRIEPPSDASAAIPVAPAAPAASPANAQRQRASQLAQALRQELQRAVLGQDAVIDDLLTALLAGGHVLVEGVPGLGKTLLVRALASCFGGEFSRIQFTPDLMPSDVTGHAVYDLQSEQFKLRKGPVFTNLLLADEINRAPAKPRRPCWKSCRSAR